MAGYTLQNCFPSNAEVLSLWFTLPFHDDSLAGLAGYYWLALYLIVILCIPFAMHRMSGAAVLVALLMVTSPYASRAVHTVSGVDVAGAGMILAGVAMIFPFRSEISQRSQFIDVAFSGLLLGFAADCRVSFATPGVALLLWLAFKKDEGTGITIRLRKVTIFVACALLTGGFWYVRNWMLTGNPVFPAQLGPFAGPFTTEMQNETKLLFRILGDPGNWQQWKDIIISHTQWPFPLFLLSALGYGFALFRLLTSVRRHEKLLPEHILLLVLGLILLLGYPLMPFSGSVNNPAQPLRDKSPIYYRSIYDGNYPVRYVRQCSHKVGCLGLPVLLVILIPFNRENNHYFSQCAQFAAVITVAFLLLCKNPAVLENSLRRKVACYVCLLALFSGLSVCYPHLQRRTNGRIRGYGGPVPPVGSAWREIDSLLPGLTIAWFGSAAHKTQ